MMRLDLDIYKDRIEFLDNIVIPDTVKVKLKQHIGLPAQPCVKEGRNVKCGEVIAEVPREELGADVHASIDGRVARITDEYIEITK